jgi:hypothetical protein
MGFIPFEEAMTFNAIDAARRSLAVLALAGVIACDEGPSGPTASGQTTSGGTVSGGGLFASMTVEQLVDSSQLIVVGELVSLTTHPNLAGTDLGTIRIDETILSRAARSTPDRASLLVPARGGLAVSTAVYYTVGQRGVWFLRRDSAQAEAYLADHPQRLMAASEASRVRAVVASRP